MSHEPGLTKVEVVDSGGDALGVAGNPLVVTSSGAGGVVDQGIAGTAVEAWWVKPTADGVTASLPLPSGAATEASLSSIDGKLPAIGPQLSAQSLSVTFATNVPPLTVNAQVVGAGASGSAVSGNPVLTAGSDGTNARTIKTDTAGRGTQAGYAHYMFLNAAATTTLLSGAGVLRSVSIGATSTGSVVVYDNTAGSGTVIHSLNGTLSGFFPLNCVVSTGITVVITGTPSVCVVWD